MDKLDLQTPDLTAGNIDRIAELFPNCVTESRDDEGNVKRAVDFDLLRQELSADLVEGPQERYRLDWPGKRAALAAANAPIDKTLRPCPEESMDFEDTKNLFIEGDNLDALKLLQETYLGKVKMIYIDPPYNTGNDFIYEDDFSRSRSDYQREAGERDEKGRALIEEERWRQNSSSNGRFHSDWLSMMYPRLKLARNLMSEDGVIFISIDDGEVHNLRKIGEEVFGEHNFVATIIWRKVYSPKNSAKWFSVDHDYILVFAKNKDHWRPDPLPRSQESDDRYRNPDNDPRGPWKAADMSARNRYDAGIYPVECPSGRKIDGPPKGRYWVIDENRFKQLNRDNRIWWGSKGNNTPAIKKFLSEVSNTRTPQTFWNYDEVGHTQDAKKSLLKYVDFVHTENMFNTVKPTALIQRMLQLAGTKTENPIILDFFSGSGSTAHGVIEQNSLDKGTRRFIGVQVQEDLPIPEKELRSILDLSLSRIKSLGKSVNQKNEDRKIDTGFRVLKIDSSNRADIHRRPADVTQDDLALHVESLKGDRTDEDLLFQVLLDWGVDLTSPITEETLAGKPVFFVDDNALAACFAPGVDDDLIRELAKREPLRAVFRDSGFADDAAKINAGQLFKTLSPHTELKTI